MIKAAAETKTEKNDGRPIPAATRLHQHLMAEYDHSNPNRVFRPNFNTSETMHIIVGLALIAMLDYDDVNNIATFHTWERHLWKDVFLQWNPEDSDGVDHIQIPTDHIWKPDLAHYNGFDPSVKHQDARAVISYDGTVMWIPAVLRKVQCHEPTSNIIKCYLKFGSWTYDGWKINIDFYDELEEIDITDYTGHPDYALMSRPAKKTVKYYPCCAEPYPDLTFTMSYIMKFLLPMILIFLPTLVLVTKAAAETKIEKNDSRPIPAETRIYEQLMTTYEHFNPSRVFRPNFNTTETMNIKFGLAQREREERDIRDTYAVVKEGEGQEWS